MLVALTSALGFANIDFNLDRLIRLVVRLSDLGLPTSVRLDLRGALLCASCSVVSKSEVGLQVGCLSQEPVPG